MFAIIQAAGWPIWFLLIASMLALALIVERTLYLRRNRILPPTLLQEVIRVYQSGKINRDVIDKLAANSPLGRVLAAGLRNVDAPREVMKESIEEAGRGAAHELERFLTTLGTIASPGAADGPVRHGGRHDRDFRRAERDRHQPGAAGARHLGGAVQHRLRPGDRHAGRWCSTAISARWSTASSSTWSSRRSSSSTSCMAHAIKPHEDT